MPTYFEQNKERILPRVDSLVTLFKDLSEIFGYKSVELSKQQLYLAVISYFQDIDRYKDYIGTDYVNKYKRAGYTIKWISKMKPVQVNTNEWVSRDERLFNNIFAVFAGLQHLDIRIDFISDLFFNELIYYSTYRNISGRNLSSMMYLLEKACNQQLP